MIYLDYASSTPVDSEVLDIYVSTIKEYYYNPNSNHKFGIKAKELLDKYTENIAHLLGIKSSEIIYTSGATESNNLVINGIANRYKNYGKHILLSSLEHQSLIAPATKLQENGFEVELIPINKDGIIDINALQGMIRDDTILVSVCSIDSELGIKQPIEEIRKLLKNYDHVFFHTDASQIVGKVDFNFNIPDLITITPHKFYGMNGISILVKKENVSLTPMILGGKSTTIYRSGTPDLASISALYKALDIAIKEQRNRLEYVTKLNNKIIDKLKTINNIHINSTKYSIPYFINISVNNIKANDLMKKLEEKDIILSPKTSCCPTNTPSKLVYALTHDKNLSNTSIRVSLSHLTTYDEVDEFLRVLESIVGEDNGKI